MPASPTPSSPLRMMVLVRTPATAHDAWTRVEAAALAGGARGCAVEGRSIFVFNQPIDALRFMLELPQRAAGCRMAAHVGDLQEIEVDPSWAALGACRNQARSSALATLDTLLAHCVPAQRLLSRPAAALVRRAAQGHAVAMPDGWDCQLGDGTSLLSAFSLDPLPDRYPDEAVANLDSRQPLPSRPHWWLERRLPPAGPLQRALLRNHKSGMHALLQMADEEVGREHLLAQRAALADNGAARASLSLGDGRLEALPAFLVSELGGASLVIDWLATQESFDADAASTLLRALADLVSTLHAEGCVHGALDIHAVARTADGSLRLYGARLVADAATRTKLQQNDCAALATMLFGLLVGDPSAVPDAFWERRVADPAARELIAACLDPGHPRPVRDIEGLRAMLERVPAPTVAEDGAQPRRRWWAFGRPRPARGD